MHPEAYRFIVETIGTPTRVLEIGSLDINGSPRGLVLEADWYGIDLQAGAAVDEIADAASIWSSAPKSLSTRQLSKTFWQQRHSISNLAADSS